MWSLYKRICDDFSTRKYKAYRQEYPDALRAHALWYAGIIVYLPCDSAGIRGKDYGIYNVVGGFVAMFSMISSSLSSSVSRFLIFELGRGDMEQLKKEVFSTFFAFTWFWHVLYF